MGGPTLDSVVFLQREYIEQIFWGFVVMDWEAVCLSYREQDKKKKIAAAWNAKLSDVNEVFLFVFDSLFFLRTVMTADRELYMKAVLMTTAPSCGNHYEVAL